MWDADDDCCERRCTTDHPCKEGDGHCESDSECQNPGWLKCGDNRCLDQTYFPRNIFTNNTETYQYTSADNCCYRVCNPRYHLCGNNEVGCLTNADCQTGLFCNTIHAQPRCEDINECTADNGHYEGLLYCGDNAVCANNVGSFTCTCNTGYTDFQPHAGCVDINECDVGGNNCKSNTDCWNTPGSFLCACKIGFTGNPTSKCIDIDECLDSTWNDCKTNDEIINTQICDKTAWTGFPLDPVNILDGKLHKYSFSAISNNDKFSILIEGGGKGHKFRFDGSQLKIQWCAGPCTHLKSEWLLPERRLANGVNNFNTYFISVQYENDKNSVKFGINNDTVIASIIEDNYKLDKIKKVYFRNDENWKQCSYVQNFKKAGPSSTCMNTVGSYTCIDDSSEKIGIGFGGYTTSGSDYAPEITVITANKAVCSDHKIPDFGGRYSPGLYKCLNLYFTLTKKRNFDSKRK